jgi:6-phosphogluconolactonase (cycloisomerase 2 family)
MPDRQDVLVYVGNWDRYKPEGGIGFGIFRYHAETGDLSFLKSAIPDVTVGAACLDRRRGILYCCDEYTTLPGYYVGGGGRVFALRIDPASGDLHEINHQPSYGSLPSYVMLDRTGKYLLVTHHTDRTPVTKIVQDPAGPFRIHLEYDDATTVLFPLHADSSIGDPCDVFKHSGDGGPLRRQTHPQLHSVTMSPSGRLFAVCDKGNDEVMLFRIDEVAAKLHPCGKSKSIPGSSPRYSAFHPTLPYLFVNHETKAVVASLRYDEEGTLEPVCTVSALPEDREDGPTVKQSDIAVHPNGRCLYSLIRGLDAVSVFEIDEKTGRIDRVQTVALDSAGPRGCAVSPDGRFLLIAALEGKEVVVWAIGDGGRLAPTGKRVSQPNPGTVTFYEMYRAEPPPNMLRAQGHT